MGQAGKKEKKELETLGKESLWDKITRLDRRRRGSSGGHNQESTLLASLL